LFLLVRAHIRFLKNVLTCSKEELFNVSRKHVIYVILRAVSNTTILKRPIISKGNRYLNCRFLKF